MDRQSTPTQSELKYMLLDENAKPKALPLSLLEEITKGFSQKQEIGRGGYAVVYKGMLDNGAAIAVKRLSNTYMYEKQFHREIECLIKVKHKNVVRFIGYCADSQGIAESYNGKFVMADVQQRLLCFEHLPHGTLDKYITDASCGLDWRMRYKIINGICDGLHYLHDNRILHLDLKPQNILLDGNMLPKITDFGLSRCFDEEQSRAITSNIGGTMGYLAPEFGSREITYRFDLYSLGAIIIEILTGKKGYEDVENVLESWSNRLENSCWDIQREQVQVCTEIAIECIESNPAKRPVSMQHIIVRLHETRNTEGSIETIVTTSSTLQELVVTRSRNFEQVVAPIGLSLIDSYSKLVCMYPSLEIGPNKGSLLPKMLSVTVRVIQNDVEEKKASFDPRPYFWLFINWLNDLTTSELHYDGANFEVLAAFANAFDALQPLRIPGFSFAWLELVSHGTFMPRLLMCNSQKGWPLFHSLLVGLFKFMEPYLRNAELVKSVRLLYEGTMKVLLVLLHDFPDFLCDYHFSFCDVIPSSCIQMRNVILSAYPRSMKIPHVATPNLKVDLLPEILEAPRIMSKVDGVLKSKHMKTAFDEYLKRPEGSSFLSDLKQNLLLPQNEANVAGTRYNVPLINSLVLYVGIQVVQTLQQNKANASGSVQRIIHIQTDIMQIETAIDFLRNLVTNLDTEGRYLLLNAIVNQLRYPNSHTLYFSFVILYLFAEATQENIQEQITRVLLERLIVNHPRPWGLQITFIELVKNPRYNFWNRSFAHTAPEIKMMLYHVVHEICPPRLPLMGAAK